MTSWPWLVTVVAAAIAAEQTPLPDTTRLYTVEVGVSRSRSRLETLATKLEGEVMVVYEAPYYRLFVGAWADRPSASQAAERLRPEFGRAIVRDLGEELAYQKLPRPPEIAAERNDENHFRLVAPDERELWRLLEQARYGDFKTLMETYRHRYPRWRPAKALNDQLAWLEAEASIRLAVESNDRPALIALSRVHPGHFDCGGVNRLWMLSEALFSAGFEAEAEALYRRTVTSCDREYLLPTLQKASERLPPEVTGELLNDALNRLAAQADDPVRAEVESFEYEFRLARTIESEARGDDAAVTVFARTHGPDVLIEKDTDAAALIAWSALRTGELETSEHWFREALSWAPTDASIAYGLLLTRIRLGRLDEAVELARVWSKSTEIRELIAGALRKDAARNFAQGEYGSCLSRLLESQLWVPNRRDEELLRAWSLYHLARYDSAAALFRDLYTALADDETAEGLLLSLALDDRWGELDRLSRRLGSPFREHWEQARAKRAIEQGQFLLAGRLRPRSFPELQNIDAPAMGGGLALGTRRGGSGFERLRIQRVSVLEALVTVHGTHRIGGRIDRLTLESHVFQSGRPFGSSTEPLRVEELPAGAVRTSTDARLLYYREAPLSFHAELGSTHRAGPIRPRATFRFGVSRVGEKRDWGLDFFSRSVRESLLSSSGLVDSFAGRPWGRVVESGATYHGRQRIAADVELLLRASMSRLTGVDVADNWHQDVYTSVGRRIDYGSLGQASIGPWLYLSSFRENLSEFTRGHGGYFSPQLHVVGGGIGRFTTHEGRRVASRARVAIGYQAYRKESAPLFPEAPDGRLYAEEKASGLVYALDWQGAFLIGEKWHIGGAVRMDRSADWSERSGTVYVRFTLGPRRALFSRDLDETALDRLF